MARRVVQILLLLSLLTGVLAQAVTCATLMQESHACCQTLTSKARLTAQTTHSAAQLPPCCQTSTPQSPQPLPVEKREFQALKNILAETITASLPISFSHPEQARIKLHAPAGYSPPSFLLHHALLI
jgi:hypothetical protein